MWMYAVALAPGTKDRALHSEPIRIKIIDSLEVKIVYTVFDDPKEAVVRAASQKLYEGDKHLDKTGMADWTRKELEEISLDELITYYRYSGTGLYISIPVLVPGQ